MLYIHLMKNAACRQMYRNVVMLVITVMQFPMYSISQQTRESMPLTLERARAIALEKSPEMMAAKLDASINAVTLTQAKLNKRPQLSADLNVQRNLIIPVTPVPANAFDPTAPDGKLVPLRFTTKWTSNAGVTASIELFNPQQKLAIQEAEIRERITQLENTQLANDLSYNVGVAYMEALIAAEQLRLAVADTLTKATLVQLSRQQYEEGRLLLTTFNQVRASRNMALNQFDEAQTIYTNAVARLLTIMGYAPNELIDVVFMDTLEGLYGSYQVNLTVDTLNSVERNKQIQENNLLTAQIQAAAKGSLPSLVLKGYLGANYFDNSFEILRSANWNGNSFINLGLRVPISGSLKRQKEILQLQLQQQANQLRYISKRNKNTIDHAKAIREMALFERNLLRAKENVQLAQSDLRLAEQQFTSGRLRMEELNQVEYAYQKEKNNYLNVAYKFVLAKLDIEKMGKY